MAMRHTRDFSMTIVAYDEGGNVERLVQGIGVSQQMGDA